jgi:hypothetical protein
LRHKPILKVYSILIFVTAYEWDENRLNRAFAKKISFLSKVIEFLNLTNSLKHPVLMTIIKNFKGGINKSMRSISSSHSSTASTRVTMENKHDSDRHKYYYLNGEALVAKVHKAKPIFTPSDFVEMRFVSQKILGLYKNL